MSGEQEPPCKPDTGPHSCHVSEQEPWLFPGKEAGCSFGWKTEVTGSSFRCTFCLSVWNKRSVLAVFQYQNDSNRKNQHLPDLIRLKFIPDDYQSSCLSSVGPQLMVMYWVDAFLDLAAYVRDRVSFVDLAL